MRSTSFLIGAGLLLLLLTAVQRTASADAGTIPATAPTLVNGDFECTFGYSEEVNTIGETIRVPLGWRYQALTGSPRANSARIQYTGSCDGSGHVERISGDDSFSLRSQDMETPPTPGKPFDSVLYQQVAVSSGGDYSLSGWTLTLCGGSAVPSDCPEGTYMAKMLGLDPTGGVDPAAESVIWVENRFNFVSSDRERIGWQNLYLPAAAKGVTMTVFARINSPFQWHGNHGFIDALSLIRAPVVQLTPLPATAENGQVKLTWQAEQSPDVEAIAGGNYRLLVDLERRVDGGDWRAIPTENAAAGSRVFVAPCTDRTYQFRMRARAEQPDGEEGAWPNHRYPGVWSAPQAVDFLPTNGTDTDTPVDGPYRIYLPYMQRDIEC